MLAVCLTSLGKGWENWSLCSLFASPHWGKGERAGRCGRRLPHLTGEWERDLVAMLTVYLTSQGKGRESWSLCSTSALPHWGKGKRAGRCACHLPHLTGEREKKLVAVLSFCLTLLGEGRESAGRYARGLPHLTGVREKGLVALLAVCLTSLWKGRESWSLCSPSASPHWGDGERAGRYADHLPHLTGERERELVVVFSVCLTSLGKWRESWSLCSPSASPHWGMGERAGRCAGRLPHLTGERERKLVAVFAVCLTLLGKGRERAGRCVRRLPHLTWDKESELVALLAICLTSLVKGSESWSLCSPSASLSGEWERELVAVFAVCLTSLGKGSESWSLCSPSASPHWGKGERAGRCEGRLPHLTGERERKLVAVLAVCLRRESWSLCSPSASPHWG